MSDTSAASADRQATIAVKHAQSQRLFGFLVLGFSFGLLALVAGFTLWSRAFSAELVFTTVTTLVGTWVGTLLAFFYSKENFESASRSVQKALERMTPDERLQSISAESAMVPYERMIVVRSDTPNDLPLAALKTKFKENPTATRLPILKEDKSAYAIVHQSALDKFVEANPTLANPTLKDLLADPDGARAKVLLFLSRQQTLRDAHAAIQLIRDAKDVFVTETGAGKEPVLGWITDTTVIDKMRP